MHVFAFFLPIDTIGYIGTNCFYFWYSFLSLSLSLSLSILWRAKEEDEEFNEWNQVLSLQQILQFIYSLCNTVLLSSHTKVKVK